MTTNFLKVHKYIFLLIILGLFTYINSLQNGFVWDDFDQLVRNVAVHSLQNINYFFSGSTFYAGGAEKLPGLYYKPFLPLSFAVIYSLFGGSAFSFHAAQVILHIINGVLLFLFLKTLIKDKWAFFVSLLFLIHPINTESVVYIAALQEVLYFFFGIAALLVLRQAALQKKQDRRLFFGVCAAFLLLCATLSKETGFLFVFAALAYVILFFRKYSLLQGLSTLLVLGVYAQLRFVMAGVFFHKVGLAPIIRASLEERILTMPKVFFTFLWTFVWPVDLAISQHWLVREAGWQSFYLPLLVDLCVFGALAYGGVWLWRQKKKDAQLYMFFAVWFVLGLGLHSQLVPLDMTYADRWFYFPSVGLLGMLVLLVKQLVTAKNQKLFLGLFVILCSLLIIRVIVRNTDWKDIFSLYAHDIRISTESFDLENNYGVALYRQGKFAEAEKHFKRSTELAPYWYTNWINMGLIAERKGDIPLAKKYYKVGLDHSGAYFAFESLSRINLMSADYKEAKRLAFAGLNLYPKNTNLALVLALAEYNLGEQDEAEFVMRKLLTLSNAAVDRYVADMIFKKRPVDLTTVYKFE